MGKRKPGLTLEKHKAIGSELRAISEQLTKISVQVSNAYSVSSRHGGYSISGIGKAIKGIDSARCWLEECLFDDCPADADISIYYGGD